MNTTRKQRILRTSLRIAGGLLLVAAITIIFARAFAPEVLRQGLFSLFGNRFVTVTIATGSEKGNYHRLAELLETRLYTLGVSSVTVIPTDGSLENIELVQSGAVDFGLVQGGLQESMAGLCAVASLERQYVHFIVPRESAIQRFRDVAGKRISFGPVKGGSYALGQLALEFGQLKPAPEVIDLPVEDLGKAFEEGTIDAAVTVFSLYAPVMEELFASGNLRLVPLPETEAFVRFLPATFVGEIPVNVYGPARSIPSAREGALPTLAVDTILVTRCDARNPKVTALLEAIYSSEFIKLARLTGLTEERGRKVVDLPLHPAAAAFYRRHSPISSDKFEIASFFLAGLIGLVSAFHFLTTRRQSRSVERRRMRIMPYFEEMLTFGTQVEQSEDTTELTDLLSHMMASQRRAEQEWLQGKLDTEHMDNLYELYSIRSRNTFSKMLTLQFKSLEETVARLHYALRGDTKEEGPPRPDDEGQDNH